jgi:hypothetical protein
MLFKFPPKLGSKAGIIKYLETDLWTWFRDLSVGLLKINFAENFESFRVENLNIKNGQEVAIPNQLKTKANNSIPTSRIIVRQKGNGLVTDGPTAWTSNLVYLINNGPDDVTISVIFFK